jgi:hypothetical protein
MLVKKTDRKGFLDVLSGMAGNYLSGVYTGEKLPGTPPIGDGIYVVWDTETTSETDKPIVIIVADGKLRDFLAWTTTYVTNFRPFTAYFRVLEYQEADVLKVEQCLPSFRGLETECVGLILGETLTLLSESTSKPTITIIACASTISYCLARAIAYDLSSELINVICERWVLTRKITEQVQRNISVDSIKDIWVLLSQIKAKRGMALGANNLPDVVVDACFQLNEERMIYNDTWLSLTNGHNELMKSREKMSGPLEDRVRFFKSLMSGLLNDKSINKDIGSFISGYLGSLIGTGAMTHIDLMVEYKNQWPNILLWYGLCCGLRKNSDILSAFNILGRRIIRELSRNEPLLSPPTSDINFSELQIIFGESEKERLFHTFSANYINVELWPRINTYLNWPLRKQERQQELFHIKKEEDFPNQPIILTLQQNIQPLLDEIVQGQAWDVHVVADFHEE